MSYAVMAATPVRPPLERGTSYFPPTPDLRLSMPSLYSQTDCLEPSPVAQKAMSTCLAVAADEQPRPRGIFLRRWLCCGSSDD